jgi:hypothetical protein
VGRSRAAAFVAGLPSYPSIVVYSQSSLSLHAPGVREVRCRDSEAAYRFRYDGLELMLESGGQYVFVPSAWASGQGVAILIPRSDSLRLEFSRLVPSPVSRAWPADSAARPVIMSLAQGTAAKSHRRGGTGGGTRGTAGEVCGRLAGSGSRRPGCARAAVRSSSACRVWALTTASQ